MGIINEISKVFLTLIAIKQKVFNVGLQTIDKILVDILPASQCSPVQPRWQSQRILLTSLHPPLEHFSSHIAAGDIALLKNIYNNIFIIFIGSNDFDLQVKDVEIWKVSLIAT